MFCTVLSHVLRYSSESEQAREAYRTEKKSECIRLAMMTDQQREARTRKCFRAEIERGYKREGKSCMKILQGKMLCTVQHFTRNNHSQ